MTLTPVAMQHALQPARIIYDIEIAPNDQWMAVSCSTDDIWIYTLSGKLLRTLHHKSGSHLVDIEISPDGRFLACSNPNQIGDYCPVWSTSTWKEVAHVGVPVNPTFYNSPGGIEYAGKGRFLVGTSMYGSDVFVWDAKTGKPAYMAKKTRYAFVNFAVNPNSSLVVLNEWSVPRMRFWDFENSPAANKWGSDISGLQPQFVRNMKFSHDGKMLFVITTPQKTYTMFNIVKPLGGKCKVTVQDQVQNLVPRDIAWAGDDSEIWISGLNGQIVCFDPAAGTLRRHWVAHDRAPIHAIAATHKGHTVVSGADKTICIWDGDTATLKRKFSVP